MNSGHGVDQFLHKNWDPLPHIFSMEISYEKHLLVLAGIHH